MQILYRQLSYKVVGCCFEVYNTLGPLYREIVYQRALEIELRRNGIEFERKKPVEVKYQGEIVYQGEIDLLVEKLVLLELKAVQVLHPQHVAQVVQYLAATGLRLGLLVNFGSVGKLVYRRIPFGANESHE